MELSEPLKAQLGMAVRVLRVGGVLAYPTDTVYGLGCDAFCTTAVVRLYEIKHRPWHMAVPLLIGDMDQLHRVARDVPPEALALAKMFWPGALTIVLPKHPDVPDIVTAIGDTVAVRLPAHAVPVFLARALGSPLVGTSANITGMPSATTAAQVHSQFGSELDLIVDGGESPGGLESTIVDLTGRVPVVLRECAIPAKDVMKAFKEMNGARSDRL
ncbi:MAG: threonylcarbamoyl-AMP synthase [Chloroflexi bacterium]|nr:threonylcarbamoyl-AMP synthase [Chloroflexota bacterium]